MREALVHRLDMISTRLMQENWENLSTKFQGSVTMPGTVRFGLYPTVKEKL
jgi:hypothetical protein